MQRSIASLTPLDVSTTSTLFDFRLTAAQDDPDIFYEVLMQSGAIYDIYFSLNGDGQEWD